MEKKRKADEDWDDKGNIKKSRIESSENDLWLQVPLEILQIILLYADPLSILLLSLTSKHWNNLTTKLLTNKSWHKIYLTARKKFKMNIEGTVLDQVLKSAQGWAGPHHEAVFEWDFEIYDVPMTSDCLKIQQDLVAEDEYLAKFPIKYAKDGININTYVRTVVLIL
eukprot:TRINITY_DN14858_c0_g1_i1.p1 TRINITY_DN14858_c0_g1~~TRINITY_DN14858_c0_g1_i1.p1  ORF type:complete len:167 (-),score=14.75 TRINITY_DN14858_c0_g1_i1:6-506(-)